MPNYVGSAWSTWKYNSANSGDLSFLAKPKSDLGYPDTFVVVDGLPSSPSKMKFYVLKDTIRTINIGGHARYAVDVYKASWLRSNDILNSIYLHSTGLYTSDAEDTNLEISGISTTFPKFSQVSSGENRYVAIVSEKSVSSYISSGSEYFTIDEDPKMAWLFEEVEQTQTKASFSISGSNSVKPYMRLGSIPSTGSITKKFRRFSSSSASSITTTTKSLTLLEDAFDLCDSVSVSSSYQSVFGRSATKDTKFNESGIGKAFKLKFSIGEDYCERDYSVSDWDAKKLYVDLNGSVASINDVPIFANKEIKIDFGRYFSLFRECKNVYKTIVETVESAISKESVSIYGKTLKVGQNVAFEYGYGDQSVLYTTDRILDEAQSLIDHYEDLRVENKATKTDYYVTASGSQFDATGIVLKATHVTYDDYGVESKEDVSVTTGVTYSTVTASSEDKEWKCVVTISWGGLDTSTEVFAYPLVMESIRFSGSDSNKYYETGESAFALPTLTVLAKYNDGTESAIDVLSSMTFRMSVSGLELVPGETKVPYGSDNKVIATYDGFEAEYQIAFKDNEVKSWSLGSGYKATLGDKPSATKGSAKFYVYRESDETKAIEIVGWSFTKEAIITSANKKAYVLADGKEYEINLTDEQIKSPTAYLIADLTDFTDTVTNGDDPIDLRNVKFKIAYKDGDRKVEFEEEVAYSSVTASCPTISGYDFFSGNPVSVDMGGSSSSMATITCTANASLTGGTASASIGAIIMDAVDIIGIAPLSVKTSYFVGDTFLGLDDDSKVRISYKTSSGVRKTKDIALNSGFSGLNVYPLVGTKLTAKTSGREVVVSATMNSSVYIKYDISVSKKESNSPKRTHKLKAVKLSGTTHKWDGKWVLVEAEYARGGSLMASVDSIKIYGYLDDINDPEKNAKVVLADDWYDPIDGSNNVTVKFPCYVKGNSDLINKCRFGQFFGSNNSMNRLFVSGNPDFANKDWRSGTASEGSLADSSLLDGNFAYFDESAYATYGESDNAVVGYSIVGTDKMLVLKGKSDKETTVYFRSPTSVVATADGKYLTDINGEYLYDEEYKVSMGNNSVAGVSPKAICSFNGDTVFLSSDGNVAGLDLEGIVGDTQRYANSRSKHIDEDLRRSDLDGATLWTDNDYLYLALGDKLYAAKHDLYEDGQYEWFPLDVANASAFLKIGDDLIIGGKDGSLRRRTDGYEDIDAHYIGVGSVKMTVQDETEKILVSQSDFEKVEAGNVKFVPVIMDGSGAEDRNVYFCVAPISNSSMGTAQFVTEPNSDYLRLSGATSDTRQLLAEGVDYYVTDVEGKAYCGSGSPFAGIFGKPLKIKLDMAHSLDGLSRYAVYLDGAQISAKDLYNAKLCRRIDFECDVCDLNKSQSTFGLKYGGIRLDLVRYHLQSLSNAFSAKVKSVKPVEKYYITAPFSMGSLEYFKTMWSYTLTNDSGLPSEMELCVASNKVPFESLKSIASISKAVLGNDYNMVDFGALDFEKNILPRTYTSKRILSNVKFACFGFRNLNATNTVLSAMTVTYTVPFPSYGD